ncbi:putative ATP-grasp superfamily ATP-dependent carboligase [Variovorax boronicumulans]|uniref:hypothetical protein n=1 Tax=Variovorax boronicumulans TaxID=436515 RepID=UPI0024740073|nr:hypothetical protein [Variovorax boronicumulans]MDH6169244.1 putative ATP-grasp superfamily ATP-dependent carboligase [Variovorax boronicumulans]
MQKQTRSSSAKNATGLAKALKENKQATKAVQAAADELAVVHTVLDMKVPKDALSPDAHRAVQQTSQLEKQLTASSKKLEKVNESLESALPKDGD